MDERVVGSMINMLGALVIVARKMGENARIEKYEWKDCPFDFSAILLRDAWLIGYSDQEHKEHLEANVHEISTNNKAVP